MSSQLRLSVAPDHVKKIISQCDPIEALSELIWNAVDADAQKVDIQLNLNSLGGLDQIVIKDDGHGLSYTDAETAFGSLGGSSKCGKIKSPQGRKYHGQEGKGRFKAFALGYTVTWKSCVVNQDIAEGSYFQIRTDWEKIDFIDFSDIETPSHILPGMEVVIGRITPKALQLTRHHLPQRLAVRFAPYLKAYGPITINIDGETINSFATPISEKIYTISVEEPDINIELAIFEWSQGNHRSLFLSDSSNAVLEELPDPPEFAGESYSAYLISDFLGEQFHANVLGLELDKTSTNIINIAKDKIKEHFRVKGSNIAANKVAELKRSDIYPYQTPPKNVVEAATREVFDMCAVKIHEYLPSFSKHNKKEQQLLLMLVKEAIEHDPSSMSQILSEVFKLTPEQRKEFSNLLAETSLGSVIAASQTVTRRLKFLHGLEQLVTETPFRKTLKERKHLQKILENEIWLFGEQYSFVSPDGGDVSLRKVLQAHIKILERETLTPPITSEELKDIPDFSLYRKFIFGKADHHEMLIVEIKRPSEVLDDDHVAQVTKYAKQVALDKRFDKEKTKWNFYLISSKLNESVDLGRIQDENNFGRVLNARNLNVYVRTWGEIIQEARGRMEFFRKQLEYQIENEEGLAYIRQKYADYLPDEPTEIIS